MREIKFRAWDKEKKIMIDDQDQKVQKHYDVILGGWIHDTVWRIGKLNRTLMQFTGLKDKNDKEIYEGDILQWPCDKEIATVTFDIKYTAFRLINKILDTTCSLGLNIGDKGQAVIIGNIYENPELLTREE